MSDQQLSHVHKVAIIGGSGKIGSYILKSLLATERHEVTVLTRTDSDATFPSDANVVKVDYTSESTIANALRGHDFLIVTLSVRSPPELHPRIVNAAAVAGVKYIMPNYYGHALSSRSGSLPTDPIIRSFERFINDVTSVQEKGHDVKYLALCCGFWYEFSLGMGEPWLGFDIQNLKVTFYDQGETKVNLSTWEICGKAVARLLSLPVEKKEDGKSALQDWNDEGVYISSFLINQRAILDSLHRVLGTTDVDWDIKYQPVKQRYDEGKKELQEGKVTGYAKAMYAGIFFPDGRGDYETGHGLDNGKLGLEEESLDEATRRAVKMVEEGFGYHNFIQDS